MAISSALIELHSATITSGTPGTYSKLVDIKDFPDLIGDPNLLETTTLSNTQQTYIPGIKSADLLTFTANFDSAKFADLKAMEGTVYAFKLIFNDEITPSTGTGSTFVWQGQLSVGLPGKGVDEVLEMTINIAPSTEVTFTEAT